MHDYHGASRRMALAMALRSSEVHITARALEYARTQIEVDHREAVLGKAWAKDTWAAQDELPTKMRILVDDMPGPCDKEYPEQWDAIGASMESPTYERCDELTEIAREAILEHSRYPYANQVIDVMDKLADESSGIDTDVAYEVLGELVYADHLQLQEGAKAALISLCGAAEWQMAAEELLALEPAP